MHITQNVLIVLRNDATTWYSVLVFFMMQPLAILQKEHCSIKLQFTSL